MSGADPRAIHLVGVGGAGMSALARLAVQAGYRVSGTDRNDSPVLAALRRMGVAARVGHGADALDAAVATVVVSTAVADDNPELVEARRRGLPVIHRSQMLAELMTLRRPLAVAGAHGKSTTSAMLAIALGDASACVGATIPGGEGTGARWGAGRWFVAEADESDRSLLNLAPEGAILLNVDHDHHATYPTLEAVREVFARFIAALPADGVLVLGPDREAHSLAAAAPCAVRLIGDGPNVWARVRRAAGRQGFVMEIADGRRLHVPLGVPGEHNATNAACALALADWCGVDLGWAAHNLAAFTGVGRRMELRGEVAGVRVIDDYAHHPTEIAATLAAARERTDGRLLVVYQPHLPSRTRALWREIGAALAGADIAVVTEVYLAREPADPEFGGARVAGAVPAPTRAVFAPELADAAEAVLAEVAPGDVVLTMGAGNITGLGQELVARLPTQYPDGEPTLHADSGRPLT